MKFSELKNALAGGVINSNGEIDIALGNSIIEKAKSLSSEIKNSMPGSNIEKDRYNPLFEFSEKLELISWCYPIKTKKVAASRVNRLNSMFCGPFFTSRESPWPDIDGKYAEPIVQLDLLGIQSISPVQFGSGMLQLWAGEWGTDEIIIRIIPYDELKKENITPVPQCIDEEYYGELRWSDAWPEVDYKMKVPCSHEILPINSKRMYWPLGLEDSFGEFELKMTDMQLQEKIRQFISIFPYDSPSTEPHLFGSFNAIQYDPVDAASTFLALEGEPCFNFNYGNAQISYWLKDNGDVEFGFAWSCQ